MNRSPPKKTVGDLIGENAWWVILVGLTAAGGLLGHLAEWRPGELIALVAVLLAAALAGMALYFWHRVRLAQADAALKQSMLQRGLTPDDIERLLACQLGPPEVGVAETEERAIEEVAAYLKKSNVSVAAMEQVFVALRDAEPPQRQAILAAIRGLAGEWGNGASEKAVLAVIRGLCGNGRPPAAGVPSPKKDRKAKEDIVAIRAASADDVDRPRD